MTSSFLRNFWVSQHHQNTENNDYLEKPEEFSFFGALTTTLHLYENTELQITPQKWDQSYYSVFFLNKEKSEEVGEERNNQTNFTAFS